MSSHTNALMTFPRAKRDLLTKRKGIKMKRDPKKKD